MTMSFKPALVGALWLVLGGAAPVGATMVVGAAGAPAPRANLGAPSHAATANVPTLDLASGVVQAVNLEKGTVTLGGKVVGLHPTQLRVFGPSGHAESGAGALRPHMHIRFALENSTAELRRIVLIYIDRQP